MAQRLDRLREEAGALRAGGGTYEGLRDALVALLPLDEAEVPSVRETLSALCADDLISLQQLNDLTSVFDSDNEFGAGEDDKTVIAPVTGAATPAGQGASETDDGTVFVPRPGDASPSDGTVIANRTGDQSTPPPTTGASASTAGTSSGFSSWSDTDFQSGDGAPIDVGSVVARRFMLEELLGKGGMGLVYRARDLLWEEAQDRNPFVAIKILNDEFKKHPESLKALQREARKSQTLAHPNIVHVYNFDRDGGTVYMTMEYLDGDPLDQVIKQRDQPFPPEIALGYIRQMGAALDYAHRHNIVHSDFKPGNVFLTKDDAIKVLDFGIARASTHDHLGEAVDSETTHFNAGDLGALTPAYASLEMFLGAEPEPNDDIYALGCVSYELLTKRHPYGRKPANKAVMGADPLQPIPGLRRRQWQALHKAVALKRQDRTRSVDELLGPLLGEQSQQRRLQIAAVATFVVAGLGAATWGVVSYLGQREVETIQANLASADEQRVSSALIALNELDVNERSGLLIATREPLTDFFVAAARGEFDLESEKYDYPGAQNWFAQALRYYPDSKSIADAQEAMSTARNQLLNELDVKFTNAINRGRLLPSAGRDNVTQILGVVVQIDPAHPFLTDPRLKLAYRQASEEAVDGGDIAAAKALLVAANEQFPADPAISAELAKVEQAQIRIERAREIADLEAQIATAVPQAETLSDLPALQTPALALVQLDPRSPALAQVQELAERLVRERVELDVAGHDWQMANQRIAEHAQLLATDDYLRLQDSVQQAAQSWRAEIAATLETLTETVRSDALTEPDNAALRGLAALEQQGADADTLRQARSLVAQGYLDLSRKYRGQRDWDTASRLVELAQTNLGAADDGRFDRELREIERAQQASAQLEQRERLMEELAQRVAGLRTRFADTLAAAPLTAAAVGEALLVIDEINSADPGNPAADASREELVGAIVERSGGLRRSQNFEEAQDLLRYAVAALPSETQLRKERSDLVQAQTAYRDQQRQMVATSAQERLESLLADPVLDASWESAVAEQVKQLQELGSLGPADVTRTRERVAQLFINRSSQETTAGRYSVARDMVERGRTYAPQLAQWERQLQTIGQRESAGRQELAAEQSRARIEGLKQTFRTQVNALDTARARDTLQEVAALAPADGFVADDAPNLLAGAYVKLAEDALQFRNHESAIDLARQGLEFVPDMPALRRLIAAAEFEQIAAAVAEYFSSGGQAGAERLQANVSALRSSDISDRVARLESLGDDVARNIRQQAGADFDRGVALQAEARRLFPNNARLRALDLEAEQQSAERDRQQQQVAQLLRRAADAETANRIVGGSDSAVAIYKTALDVQGAADAANDALNRLNRSYLARANGQLEQRETEQVLDSIAVLERIGRAPQQVASLKARRLEVQAESEEMARRAEFESYVERARRELTDQPITQQKLAGAVAQLDSARRMYPSDAMLQDVGSVVTEGYRELADQLIQESEFDAATEIVEAGLAFARDNRPLQELLEEIEDKKSSKKKRRRTFSTF